MTESLVLNNTSANIDTTQLSGNRSRGRMLALAGICVLQFGCAAVGPEFEKPEVPVVENWTSDNPVITRDTMDLRE